jgi:chemotaxis protein MotB
MAEQGAHELIIVRRHEEEDHPAHSSAWKVAHADFMTAMMAFFLIMWLINVTDENVRKGIAQYFNPIHMSQGSTQLKGLSTTPPKGKPAPGGHGDAPLPQADLNLINLTGGSAAGKPMNPEAAAAALNAAAELAAKMTAGAAAGQASAKSLQR